MIDTARLRELEERLFTRERHLSLLTLECHLIGELDPQADRLVDAHLASCAACRDRLALLRSGRAALLSRFAAVPVRVAARDVAPPRQSPRRTWMMAGSAAAALVLGWHLLAPEPRPASEPAAPARSRPTGAVDPVRLKGDDLRFLVYVERDGTPQRLYWNDEVSPGDRLGFQLGSEQAGYAMVIGIDARRQVYQCYPGAGSGASAYRPASGRAQSLDRAIALDDSPGHEHLVAVLCPQPFEFSELRRRLERWSSDGTGPPPLLRSGCMQRDLRLRKRAVPGAAP
jgi:hypothetical protein